MQSAHCIFIHILYVYTVNHVNQCKWSILSRTSMASPWKGPAGQPGRRLRQSTRLKESSAHPRSRQPALQPRTTCPSVAPNGGVETLFLMIGPVLRRLALILLFISSRIQRSTSLRAVEMRRSSPKKTCPNGAQARQNGDLVGPRGLEPRTNGLRVHCSTN